MSKPWPMVKLGEVVRDLTASRTFAVQPDDEIVDPTISSATHQIAVAATSRGYEVKVSRRIRIEPGDLVFSRLHTQNGAFAFSEATFQATGTFVPLRVLNDKAEKQFLFWALHKFVPSLSASDTVGRETYKTDDILALEIPLPPLAEQRRIVARIEELAAQIQEARTLRQQAAEEAKALTASAQSTLSRPKSSLHISVEELIGPNGLRNGRSIKSNGIDSAIRCLTLSAMRNGRINIHDSKPVPMSDTEAIPFQVHRGDVFVVRGNGSKELCGCAGLIAEEMQGVIFPDLFIQVSLPKNRVLPEYFVATWNSAATRTIIEEKAKTTSGIWKINQGHILSVVIPLPPIAEQRRIVAELDALQAEVDRLKALQVETAAELDALLPSILDRAFKGEL